MSCLLALQPGEDIGTTCRGHAFFADRAVGEAGQGRRQSLAPWSLCRFPIGRDCHELEAHLGFLGRANIQARIVF